MAGQFDPYHRWLGIPPNEQPPNHYRLLGVELFEDDLDVIESAADQRMAHLRTFQTGKHGKLSQKLLNQVAAAKICLLSPKKRTAYDKRLRRKPALQVAEAIEPQPKEHVDPQLAGFLAKAETPTTATRSRTPARKRSAGGVLLVGIVVIGASVVLGLALWRGQSTSATALLLQWPADQRHGASLQIDGKRFVVKPDGPLRLRCTPGRHEILATRPQFEPFVGSVTLGEGQTSAVRLVWKKAEALPSSPGNPNPRDGLALRDSPSQTPSAPTETPGSSDRDPHVVSYPDQSLPKTNVRGESQSPSSRPPEAAVATKKSYVVLNLDKRISHEPVVVRDPPADAEVYVELSGLASWPIPARFKDGKSQARLNERITVQHGNVPGAEINVTLLRHIDGLKLRIESLYRGTSGEFSLTLSEVQRRQKTVPGELARSLSELRSLPGEIRQMQAAGSGLASQMRLAQARGDSRASTVLGGQLRRIESQLRSAQRRLSRLPEQVKAQQTLRQVLPELRRAVDSLHGKTRLEYRVFAKEGQKDVDLTVGMGES